jgi:hypothetical protein
MTAIAYTPEVIAPTEAEIMPAALAIFSADMEGIGRLFDAPYSIERSRRSAEVLDAWSVWLDGLQWSALCPSDHLDAALLQNLIAAERNRLNHERARLAEMATFCPFITDLIGILDERRLTEFGEPKHLADRLSKGADGCDALRRRIETPSESGNGKPTPAVANRAAALLTELKKALADWYAFRAGYDPMFTWWVAGPHTRLSGTLDACAEALRKGWAHADNPDVIVGDPVGREALLADLDAALIPYTPEELIAIGDREMAWCRSQMTEAAREMGCGDDWQAALERVKQDHVPPGEQAQFVRDLAREAVAFVEQRGLLTIPALARDGWRIEMMSPERQKVNPFFLGGELIMVSYPTDSMEHDQKLMSMRGNNRPFSRATVQHELIPGHYMQHFCGSRYRPYRRLFRTPFWTEGWTLYWELRLWELGFPRTPQERIGMLFWRMHRCARVAFSLRFHLGEMTPGECVDMLTDEVGHERATAEGEVRRSFGGDYPPLYQCAYLIGGLQMLALQRELVGTRSMDERTFHDAVLRQNCMPIAMLRSALRGDAIERGHRPVWRFDDGGRE